MCSTRPLGAELLTDDDGVTALFNTFIADPRIPADGGRAPAVKSTRVPNRGTKGL